MNDGNLFRFDLWLYNEMKKRGWGRLDLAAETGLSISTVRRFLVNEGQPTLYSLALILKAFNMHMDIVDD